jgi:hypothetical protein
MECSEIDDGVWSRVCVLSTDATKTETGSLPQAYLASSKQSNTFTTSRFTSAIMVT